MKKTYIIICLVLCVFNLFGCAGVGDWSSQPLPGGYEIWRISAHNIVLCMPNEDRNSAAIVIDSEIYAISYNEHYICVQKETSEPDPYIYTKEPHGELYFYILCVDDSFVFGPYTENEFNEKCKEKNITELCDWTEVRVLDKKSN